jgi:hypothetical protein
VKVDLAELKADLVKWVAGMLVVVVGLTLTGVGTATAIILNRLSATAISAPAQRTSVGLAAAELQRPYSCRLLDEAERQCAFGQCDQRVIDRLRKECLRDGGRP